MTRRPTPQPTAAQIARGMRTEGVGLQSAFDAERWASAVVAPWRLRAWVYGKALERLRVDVVRKLEKRGDPGSLAALRALGSLREPELSAACAEAGDRLVVAGALEPAWAPALGSAQPLRAVTRGDEVYDDGLIVLVEFDHADGGLHVLGLFIDNNLGVIAKHAFVGKPLAEIELENTQTVELAEAAARITATVERTDGKLAPPVGDGYWEVRALIDARLAVMPAGGDAYTAPALDTSERERLLADFLASAEGAEIDAGSCEAEVIEHAIGFCCDHADGRPLRWSPCLVEQFLGWLWYLRETGQGLVECAERALPAWIRYAGRSRGIPVEAIEETVDRVGTRVEELFAGASAAHRLAEALAGAQRTGDATWIDASQNARSSSRR